MLTRRDKQREKQGGERPRQTKSDRAEDDTPMLSRDTRYKTRADTNETDETKMDSKRDSARHEMRKMTEGGGRGGGGGSRSGRNDAGARGWKGGRGACDG